MKISKAEEVLTTLHKIIFFGNSQTNYYQPFHLTLWIKKLPVFQERKPH